MEYMIETKNVSKIYKGEEANKGVSISVKKNSVYGLLSPNGAGK